MKVKRRAIVLGPKTNDFQDIGVLKLYYANSALYFYLEIRRADSCDVFISVLGNIHFMDNMSVPNTCRLLSWNSGSYFYLN